MLRASVDLSGKSKSGNDIYMAFLIIEENYANSILKHLKGGDDHVSKDELRQRAIDAKLSFDNDEVLPMCLTIKRTKTVTLIANKRRIKRQKNLSTRIIMNAFHRYLWKAMEKEVYAFLKKHNYELHHIVFEHDKDGREFVRDAHLKYTKKGEILELADIIALFNSRRIKRPGIIELDLSERLAKILDREFS